MALRLTNGAQFLHVPKTGGTWVERVLEKNGLLAGRVGHKHADYDHNLLGVSHLTGREFLKVAAGLAWKKGARSLGYAFPSDEATQFRFCFVRHPLSWYESWWKYMAGRGWENWGAENSPTDWHPNSLLNGLGSADFNEFVRNVVDKRPGYVSELFFAYTKPGISFVGKLEDLRSDLAYVLDYLKLPYRTETIEETAKVNASRTDQQEVRWDPDLRLLVSRLELPALIHFDYLSGQEREELGVDRAIPPSRALRRAPTNVGD